MFGLEVALIAMLAASSCDARAEIAGRIMAHIQAGAALEPLSHISDVPEEGQVVAELIERAMAAERSDEADARELAAFHFAWQVHRDCTLRTS